MNNDLAFPSYQLDPMHPGLTKREYFALHLMAGHLSGDGAFCNGAESETLDSAETAAGKAVQYTDAIIAAITQQPQKKGTPTR